MTNFPWNFNRKQFYFRRKSAVFSKFSRLHAPCGKKLVKLGSENGKNAKNRKRKLNFSSILAKSCGIFQISSQISKIFFFRSKNLENSRGFLDPHQIFQENQGFIAFLCGNIFQILAISVIFSSNFLSDFVIVAKSWLKRGPKEESQVQT